MLFELSTFLAIGVLIAKGFVCKQDETPLSFKGTFNYSYFVTPEKAGVQWFQVVMDSRCHGNDICLRTKSVNSNSRGHARIIYFLEFVFELDMHENKNCRLI